MRRKLNRLSHLRLARQRSEIEQLTMSNKHDEIMDELLKNREIRALSHDIRRCDIDDVQQGLIAKKCVLKREQSLRGDDVVVYIR